ncbi:MAG TPA: TolC family protein [Vicinamibacterales bacterium]|nr:TolC family protein [Vicinamibacterales bacterium]
MSTRTWCVAALLLVSAPAAGQTVLSEEEAIARLSLDSPRARAIRAAADVARADALTVGRWPNPRLAFDRESVAGVRETLTTVLQPLPITGRRELERDAALALADATGLRADDEVRRARADLRHAFAELAATQVRERELTRSRNRLVELARILELREAAGDAAGFDRLRAEREVIDVDADQMIAASDRARAQARLASFFAGSTDPATLVAAEAVPGARDLPGADALVARAERQRGQLQAFQKDADAASLSMRAADRRWIPEPEVRAGTKWSNVGGGDIGSVFGVQAVLPLFDHGQPEHALAEARARQAQARLEAFRAVLRADIVVARSAAVERRRAAEAYRAAASKNAGEVERIAQVSYDAGERGILDLLDAFRTSSSARVRQASLDAAARDAEIELEFVSGWEIR